METEASNRDKGSKSEQIAEDFLLKIGYHIVKKNYHFGKVGEIDIIAKDGETIVFVEVKSRFGDYTIAPLDQITPKKIKTLRRTAEAYLYEKKIYDVECRFDVIAVEYDKGKPQIEHLINALIAF